MPCVALQTVSQGIVYWTVDGLVLVRALWLVAAVLRAELAPNLRLQMAAKTVKARQLRRAIHKLVQVQAACVHALGVCFVAFCIAFGTSNLLMISLDTHIYCVVADGVTGDAAQDGGWSGFGACSKACDGGTQIRNCSNPAPANGGKDCVGDGTNACNTQACRGTACLQDSGEMQFAFVVLDILLRTDFAMITRRFRCSGVTDGL